MRYAMLLLAFALLIATGLSCPALAQEPRFDLSKLLKGPFDIPDLTKFPQAKESLDKALAEVKKHAQGNEAGATIKSASAKDLTLGDDRQPTGGTITIVFDLHHRHRTTRDGEILGLPGIVAYDRHDEVPVEYDVKTRKGKARLAKGPLDMPLLPKVEWELWTPFEAPAK